MRVGKRCRDTYKYTCTHASDRIVFIYIYICQSVPGVLLFCVWRTVGSSCFLVGFP